MITVKTAIKVSNEIRKSVCAPFFSFVLPVFSPEKIQYSLHFCAHSSFIVAEWTLKAMKMDETTNGIRSKVTFHLCSSWFSCRVSSYHIYFVHNRNLPYPIFIYTKNRFCFRTLFFPLTRFRPRPHPHLRLHSLYSTLTRSSKPILMLSMSFHYHFWMFCRALSPWTHIILSILCAYACIFKFVFKMKSLSDMRKSEVVHKVKVFLWK